MSKVRRLFRSFSRLNEVARALRTFRQPISAAMMYAGLRSSDCVSELSLKDGTPLALSDWHDLATAWILFCRGEYVVPRDAKVVVDAGANIGLFSLLACRSSPCRVFALEPFPQTLARLQSNLKTWGLGSRVKVLPIALGAQDGELWMDCSPAPSQSRGVGEQHGSNSVRVNVMPLSSLLNDVIKDAQIDLLKVDIEGSEHAAFSTADANDLAKVRAIQMEYHPNQRAAELMRRIAACGFKKVLDRPAGRDCGTAHFVRDRA